MVLPPPLKIKLCNSSELHCKDKHYFRKYQILHKENVYYLVLLTYQRRFSA